MGKMEDDAKFAMTRIKEIEKTSGKLKEVVMGNTEKAGFLLKCLKCGSTIVAIVPTTDPEGQAVMLWCMKCENTMFFGAAIKKEKCPACGSKNIGSCPGGTAKKNNPGISKICEACCCEF